MSWLDDLPSIETPTPAAQLREEDGRLDVVEFDTEVFTLDMSGFGGEYEWVCQVLLLRMMAAMKKLGQEKADRLVQLFQRKDKLELEDWEMDLMVEFDKEVTSALGLMTPSMPQYYAALGNVIRMQKWGGYVKWLDRALAERASDVFMFKGSVASIPGKDPRGKTSQEMIEELLNSGRKGEPLCD